MKQNKKAVTLLNRAWQVQSEAMKRFGICVCCGSTSKIQAGHMAHGSKGKEWSLVDFNVTAHYNNIFPQCCFCNGFNPDGNGLLVLYCFKKGMTIYDYIVLQEQRKIKWNPTLAEAEDVLEKTKAKYTKVKV